MKFWKSIWRVAMALVLLSGWGNRVQVNAAPPSRVTELIEAMTPEEKVGQLFLVGFDGDSLEENQQLHELITDYHIGGVVFLAENDNFSSDSPLSRTQAFIGDLQQLKWDSSQTGDATPLADGSIPASYVPLLVGIPQIGNGFPGDHLLQGMTKLPSEMAIGAAWDFNLAASVGATLGDELSALGFNLLLGPNLDVLESSRGESASYLGVKTFGGDPFWVGELGKAFINGVHSGSNDRVLVVAQNFPGTGNSDRSPEEEVATVRKSLEQLTQIELAPYFSVTQPGLGSRSRVDAVMVSHIRYQGFQGNIRATTKPISFDVNALQQIMALPPLDNWRTEGGLIISENLGSGAVTRFFDPDGTNFPARQVALNAFLAGNDILFVNHFQRTGDPDTFTTIKTTLDYFVQKYREDSVFAQRVDGSVERILEAKLRLYGEFSIEKVLPNPEDLDAIGKGQAVTFNVAQNAVTLISPSQNELDSLLPSPPLWHENVIIFTDVRTDYQCSGCPPINILNTGSMANTLVSLYGPQAGGQIIQQNLTSYTYNQLSDVLDQVETGANEYLADNLRAADWVIFNQLDVTPAIPSSRVLQRMLEDRPDLLSGKRVIVFSLDSPVYLDATNISKLTAYYALYSKAPAFVDVAARVLMQEITPAGALPISLDAVGYDLISMTAPDPNQIITLALLLPDSQSQMPTPGSAPGVTQTPEPTQLPMVNVGETITIRTGVIQDHNGHAVPDGTVVRFNFRISGEPGITQQFETTTTGGTAYFNYRIEAAGGLEVSASSEPATQSETLNINIEPDGRAAVFAVSPTPLVSPTSTEMPFQTATPDLTPTMAAPEHGGYPTLGEWALGVILIGLGGALTFIVGQVWWGTTRWGIRSMLAAVIGGLLSYTYLNLGLAGTQFWLQQSGTAFVAEVVVVGILLGWIGALVWWLRTDGSRPQRKFKR